MPGYYNTRCLGKMAEVVIVRIWKDKIEEIDGYLSETREITQKLFDTGWKRIEKNHGKVSQSYIDSVYDAYEELKQIDRALEGRFNIILAVESRWEDAYII